MLAFLGAFNGAFMFTIQAPGPEEAQLQFWKRF